MKIVLDTNIYISALILPGGQAEKAIFKILEEKHELLISKPILNEILMVLSKKFIRDRENLSRVALWITDIATFVIPKGRIEILKDEPDNRILECAIEGNADIIVTGDKDMLKLRKFKNIKIISLKYFLKNYNLNLVSGKKREYP